VPLSLDEARRLVGEFVAYYNTVRLHSAIGYVTPKDKLEGRDRDIFDQRDRKLAEARQRRKEARRARAGSPPAPTPAAPRPAIDFDAIRAAIGIAAVLQLLGCRPAGSPGAQQRGPCPLHGSTAGTSRCFSANLEANCFHCFKCGRSGNALDLWAAATGQSPYDAAVDLCGRLNIPLPHLASAKWNREEEPVAPDFTTDTMPSPRQ
jgi:hypothetical protein